MAPNTNGNLVIASLSDAEKLNEFVGDAPFEPGCLPTAVHLNHLCEHHGPFPDELSADMTRIVLSGLRHARHPRATAVLDELGLSSD